MKIGFIGDIILSDQLSIDQALIDQLASNDFNVANLEAPFIDASMKPRRGKGLHQLTDNLDVLKQLNVNAVSLANNHMMDFEVEAIKRTRDHLNENGILCFGAGLNLEESIKPCVIELNGKRIELYGALQRYALNKHFAGKYKGGIAPWDIDLLPNDSTTAYRVLFVHWNREFEDYPEPVSKWNAEKIAESFNLVVGSHSHCIQGVQLNSGNPIVHSLGNFALPHTSYSNTSLSGYPEKCYTGMVYVWDSDEEDRLLLTEMSKDGLKVKFIDEGKAIDISQIKKLSEPLRLKEREYKKFYLQNRIDKRPPILSKSKSLNFVKFGLYVRSTQLFHRIELVGAKILDDLRIRALIKKALGLFIKRYN